ncbi:MAG: ATP-grasp domain-containing protein [Fidelibacterota bacterium]
MINIAITYNKRTGKNEEQGELYYPEEIDHIINAIDSLGYRTTAVEVSGPPDEMVDRLLAASPDLIFNIAEGRSFQGIAREAYYPVIFELLGLPYTGGKPSVLYASLDKRLTAKLLKVRGITIPKGAVLTPEKPEIPDEIPSPLFLKPNYEGSGKGISQESVVEDREEAQQRVRELLEKYSSGVLVEQFISGRELTVPFLDDYPGTLLEIVEHDFSKARGKYNIYDYELKMTDENVRTHCPPHLDMDLRLRILDYAARIRKALPCYDFGRIDLRLREDGTIYFLEINPLARLMPDGSLIIAAKEKGLEYEEVFNCIIKSAARRNRIPLDGTKRKQEK